jgi:hypothetical protein
MCTTAINQELLRLNPDVSDCRSLVAGLAVLDDSGISATQGSHGCAAVNHQVPQQQNDATRI